MKKAAGKIPSTGVPPWHAATVASIVAIFVVMLNLIACSPTYPTNQEFAQSDRNWCLANVRKALPDDRKRGEYPISRADACKNVAGRSGDPAGLPLYRQACLLDDDHCKSYLTAVSYAVKEHESDPTVQGMRGEASKLCLRLPWTGETDSGRSKGLDGGYACWMMGIADEQMHDVVTARQLYEKSCKLGEDNGCRSLNRLTGTEVVASDEIAHIEQARLTESARHSAEVDARNAAELQASSDEVAAQNARTDAALGSFLAAHGAPGNNTSSPPSKGAYGTSAATAGSASTMSRPAMEAMATRVAAEAASQCQEYVGSSVPAMSPHYKNAACQAAYMYNHLPADWPDRDMYRQIAQQNAAQAKELESTVPTLQH